MRPLAACLLLSLPLLGACRTSDEMPEPPPLQGKLVDLQRFEAFIRNKPTPDEFRREYPNVQLVLPGEIASRERRLDRSRYFANLDAEGRIFSGFFQ